MKSTTPIDSRIDPDLALVSFALAPSEGGAEADVAREFARALGVYWRGNVTSYSAGGSPGLEGLHSHAFEAADSDHHLTRFERLSERLLIRLRNQALASRWSPGRIYSRSLYLRSGYRIKYHAWERWTRTRLRQQLAGASNAVVLSRALPLCSLAAAFRGLAKRTNRWIVNLNDPCPPGLLPDLYPLDSRTQRLQARTFERLLGRIDAFTFPCRRLFELHASAYPQILNRPVRIIPHLAPELPTDIPPKVPSHDSTLRIGFAGTLRSYLPPPSFIDALNSVAQSHPIEIHAFVTTISPPLERLVQEAGCEVKIRPRKNGEEIDRGLAEMDALLCLEGEIDQHLLLTKLVSYLRFSKPILGVCVEGGTSFEVLQRIQAGLPVAFDDAHQIAEGLLGLVQLKAEGVTRPRTSEAIERFGPEPAIASLRDLLADIDHGRTGLQGANWP